MISFFKKPYIWAVIYSLALVLFTLFVMLEAFVIPRHITPPDTYPTNHPTVTTDPTNVPNPPSTDTENYPIIDDNSYRDENISVTITEMRYHDTTCYIADIKINSIFYLKTALAQDTYGKNIIERTSSMARRKNAIIAINGDYYGFRTTGFVVRNGKLYRTEPRTGRMSDGIAVFYDGSFYAYDEKTTDAADLFSRGAYQTFTFGPTMLSNATLKVSPSSEVDAYLASNQRAGIGIIEPLHYVFVVSDGRTDESAGLSLYQFAELFDSLGCTDAYNLDGGGSATMCFMGKVINVPTPDGVNIVERKVSDCVYIGY